MKKNLLIISLFSVIFLTSCSNPSWKETIVSETPNENIVASGSLEDTWTWTINENNFDKESVETLKEEKKDNLSWIEDDVLIEIDKMIETIK